MLDQPWLVLASTLFDHHVLKDRGCNVAGWNLHARDVHWVGDRPTIDGGPLRHFHFACGYDPERPELLARDQKYWPTLAGRPGVARLSREYARRLLDNGYVQERMRPVQGVAMLSGAPIEPWMRVVYRSALINAEQNGGVEPPNPFAHGEEHFSAWIRDRAVPTVDALMKGGASAWPEAGAPDLQAFELVAAMARVRELAPRIGELEAIRDDAIAWAQREADRSRAAAAERDALARQLEDARAVMTSVWNSPSWRLTRPLRGAKASVMGLRSRRRHPDVGSVSETRQAT
jgi:phage terminase Nu1 subunit (DNA packaging protein)